MQGNREWECLYGKLMEMGTTVWLAWEWEWEIETYGNGKEWKN